MKKIRYNSWIARKFLFEDYNTITLFAWVCTKYETKQAMPQHVRNHECTHARQWAECMLVSGVIIWGGSFVCRYFCFLVHLVILLVLYLIRTGMAYKVNPIW